MSEELCKLREEFYQHVDRFDTYRADQDGRMDRLCSTIQNNTKAVEELTKSTEGVITLYNNANAVQTFFLWLAKVGVVGGVIAGGVAWIAKHFSG